MTDSQLNRPLRADARRNRERVLKVAQEVFAKQGAAAPIEEIARRAGFGVGTLYRHFPTKAALLEAIVRERLGQVIDDAQTLETTEDPAAGLFTFLERLIAESAVKKHLSDALSGTGFDWQRAAGTLDVRKVLERLLSRAQRSKQVRRDLTVEELLALLGGVLIAMERFDEAAGSRARLFEVLCDGLRAR